MIPQRLTLRNFMSYGDEPTTLDFTQLHLVCLSGDNGNGKSALLDAITYALWGETRASGSQAAGEDDLVRLGAEEMEVLLEFQLGADLYRALRRRNRRTRSSDWSVQIAEPGGAWRPIGGSTMRETKEHLQRILRMSYDTFLNSAYLQQGRADEFTRQRPDRRKAILAEILELARYDRLAEKAKERRDEADAALKDVTAEIRMLEATLAEEPRLREQLAAAQASVEKWSQEKARREQEAQRLRGEVAALAGREQALRQREARIVADERECRHDHEEAIRLQSDIARDKALLETKPQVEARFAELVNARRRVEQLQPQEAALAAAQRNHTDAVGRLKLREQALRSQLQSVERELRDIEKRLAQIRDWDARIAEAENRLRQASEVEAGLAEAKRELQEIQDRFGAMKAENAQLQREIEEIGESIEVLRQDRAVCPICTSDLSGGKLQRVLQRQEQRLAEATARQEQLKAEGRQAQDRLHSIKARIGSLEAQQGELQGLRAKSDEWRAQRDAACAANANADAVTSARADLQRRLEENDFGHEERAEIANLEGEIARLKQAAEEAAAVRATVSRLTAEGVEDQYANVRTAAASLAEREGRLAELQERQARRQAQIAAERAAVAAERQQLQALSSVQAASRAADEALREADQALAQANSRLGAEQSRIADCERARQDLSTRSEKATALQRDRKAYADLTTALGKKGVQALIIENALPEVQNEANRLLARMTENALQVELITQRTARTRGNTIETLDIRIQDDAGVRPYELYSGGEAFRVNFALRIALSRLLAQRAGACLQTLILDEGFGTQDAKGQERLVEAIQAIRDEFRLILVISHVEAMKDAFPERIEVVKTPEGSKLIMGA